GPEKPGDSAVVVGRQTVIPGVTSRSVQSHDGPGTGSSTNQMRHQLARRDMRCWGRWKTKSQRRWEKTSRSPPRSNAFTRSSDVTIPLNLRAARAEHEHAACHQRVSNRVAVFR